MDTINNTMDTQKKKVMITAIVSFIVGFGISWILFSVPVNAPTNTDSSVSDTEASSTEVTNASSTQSVDGIGSISVVDQVASKTVSIKSVILAHPGWIVIREDRDGQPGNILGAQWLPEGTFDDQFVELLRGMKSQNTYYAVLYNDDGNKLFDYKIDSPLTDNTGNVIMQKFTTK